MSPPGIYKDAWPIEQVVDYIKERSGSQFDPKLTAAFIANIDRFVEGPRTRTRMTLPDSQ